MLKSLVPFAPEISKSPSPGQFINCEISWYLHARLRELRFVIPRKNPSPIILTPVPDVKGKSVKP